ncbi:PaaI family thioesterase [Candidatus Amarobacter glycogenicus]|uniref:PaaI family thioesterase n=1 Tax=Candidatus Amarobacter glycogenicus TaxID=3140699 RepID=UPI0031CCC994
MEEPAPKQHAIFNASSWTEAGPPTGQRIALHKLAAALRKINEALVDMDASEEDLLAAAASAEQFAVRLEATRKGHHQWGFAESSTAPSTRVMLDRSPLMGLGNPLAPPLSFRVEDGKIRGTGRFGLHYEGPPGHVHGGFVAAALDELLGMAQSLSDKSGMTGTLTVRYRRPTPLHKELSFTAWVDRVEGRKIFTTGTIHDGETLCAEAEGVFISVDFAAMQAMQARERGRTDTSAPQ